jgi:hypothetical protein
MNKTDFSVDFGTHNNGTKQIDVRFLTESW